MKLQKKVSLSIACVFVLAWGCKSRESDSQLEGRSGGNFIWPKPTTKDAVKDRLGTIYGSMVSDLKNSSELKFEELEQSPEKWEVSWTKSDYSNDPTDQDPNRAVHYEVTVTFDFSNDGTVTKASRKISPGAQILNGDDDCAKVVKRMSGLAKYYPKQFVEEVFRNGKFEASTQLEYVGSPKNGKGCKIQYTQDQPSNKKLGTFEVDATHTEIYSVTFSEAK